MNKEFVPYDLAMELKELGFNEPCICGYDKEERLRGRTKKTMGEFLLMILVYTPLPFYKLWLGIVWLYNTIFFETIDQGDNGIMGPGYHRYYYIQFSWGKSAFFF